MHDKDEIINEVEHYMPMTIVFIYENPLKLLAI